MLKTIRTSFIPSALLGISLLGSSTAQAQEDAATQPVEAPPQAMPAAPAAPDLEAIFSFLPEVVATCNGEEITAAEVRDSLPPRLVMFLANGLTPSAEQLKQIAGQTVDQLINEKLLLNAAIAAGYKPAPDAAEEEVKKLHKQVGDQKFEAGLQHQGVTREELVDRIAKQMAVNNWVQKDIIPAIEVSDDEVKAFYEQNQEQLNVPERAATSHILVQVAQDADEEARAKAKAKIEGLLAEVKEGGDFAEIAKAHSDCPSAERGGDLGTITRTDTVKPFSDTAFALEEGEISNIVETQYGYHIIKTREKMPAETPEFKDVKAQLKQQVVRSKLNARIGEIVEGAREDADIEMMMDTAQQDDVATEAETQE